MNTGELVAGVMSAAEDKRITVDTIHTSGKERITAGTYGPAVTRGDIAHRFLNPYLGGHVEYFKDGEFRVRAYLD